MPTTPINISVSDFIERFLYINRTTKFKYLSGYVNKDTNEYISEDRSYLKKIHDLDLEYPEASRNKFLLTGRQVEKTTTLALIAITLAAMNKDFKMLFIHPQYMQTQEFSQERFKVIAESSPLIAKGILAEDVTDEEFMKAPWRGYIGTKAKYPWSIVTRKFKNGATANFRWCNLNPSATRGLSSNFLGFDEIQDIYPDVIPIIEETQSHSRPDLTYRYKSGTPLSRQNIASRLYEDTCQFEWLCKCSHCNFWNYLDEHVIGKTCFICKHCGREIYPKDPKHCMWVPRYRDRLKDSIGLRISQIMVPFRTFKEVYSKRHNPTIKHSVFLNEVLGLPSDEGKEILTRGQLEAVCRPRIGMLTPTEAKKFFTQYSSPIFLGVDHGSGDGNVNGKVSYRAYTVVYIGGWVGEKFIIVFMEKLLGDHAIYANQPGRIDTLARMYGVSFAMSDAGFGQHTNSRLIREFGWKSYEGEPQKDGPLLMTCSYTDGSKAVNYDEKAEQTVGGFNLNRSWAIEILLHYIITQKTTLPSMSVTFFTPNDEIPFSNDYLNIFREYVEKPKPRYRYSHSKPDDAYMAHLYCLLAGLQFRGVLAPSIVPPLDGDHAF